MKISIPTVNLADPPDFLAGMRYFAGEQVIGFRALKKDGPICDEGCLSPGSSPHSHSIVVGYQLVTATGIYEFDMEGLCQRSSSLHSTVID